jgi:hypothetical protein
LLLLVECSEDGEIRLRFHESAAELTAAHDDGESLPKRWLTPAEAAGDPNYWPEGGAFLAEVSPLQLVPEQVAVSWQAAPR